MKICGIEFAPVFIPFERRLQTLALFYFYAAHFIGAISLLLSILLLFSRFYYILLLYMSWVIYDSNALTRGYRRWEWYIRLKLWDYFRDYFPIRIIKTVDLPPSRNYMMIYHPHGILPHGTQSLCTGITHLRQELPGLTPRILIGKSLFRLPLVREQFLWMGACVASKATIDWQFTKEGIGNALILIVGGAAEALECRPGSATLNLKSKKGFIKMALRHGASIVPIFGFGENEVFNQVQISDNSYLKTLQRKLSDLFQFTIPLYYGRGIFQYSFGFLPHRKPITVVIGEPIHLEVDPEPTNEIINATHQLYIDKLTELFEEHKVKYGPNLQLKIM